MESFGEHLIGKLTEWRIGDGRSVHVEEDPWKGSAGNFRQSQDLVGNIQAQGVLSLRDAAAQGMDITGRTIWKSVVDLNLQGDKAEE